MARWAIRFEEDICMMFFIKLNMRFFNLFRKKVFGIIALQGKIQFKKKSIEIIKHEERKYSKDFIRYVLIKSEFLEYVKQNIAINSLIMIKKGQNDLLNM